MKNPLVYGKTASGDNFCNRIQEISELVNDIIKGILSKMTIGFMSKKVEGLEHRLSPLEI
jgi:hypothetical protein